MTSVCRWEDVGGAGGGREQPFGDLDAEQSRVAEGRGASQDPRRERGVVELPSRDVHPERRAICAQALAHLVVVAHRVVEHRLAQRDDQTRLLGHGDEAVRSEEHTSELQSLMRISYAVFCLKKKKKNNNQ